MIMASHAHRTPSPSRRYASSRKRTNPSPTGSLCAPSTETSVYSMILPMSVALPISCWPGAGCHRDRCRLVAELGGAGVVTCMPVDEQAGVSSLSPCLAGGVGGEAAVPGVIQPPGGEPGVDRVCVRDDRRGVVRDEHLEHAAEERPGGLAAGDERGQGLGETQPHEHVPRIARGEDQRVHLAPPSRDRVSTAAASQNAAQSAGAAVPAWSGPASGYRAREGCRDAGHGGGPWAH